MCRTAHYFFPHLSMSTSKTAKQALIFLSVLVVGFITLVTIVLNTDQPRNKVAPVQAQRQATFDVPSLISKDIDGVRADLGAPTDKDPELTPQQMQFGGTEWYNTFEKNGRELTVTFDVKTRQIVDFFISAKDDTGDRQRLLAAGNLSESDPRYSVEFVKALKDPSSYTGVKVVPR